MSPLIVPLYRRLFSRKGYGVHSPFVFDLITNVLEESRGYYAYTRLHAIALEECPTTADTVRTLFHNRTTSPIEVRCGTYETELPNALTEYGRPDCIVLDVPPDRLASLFDCCAGHLSEETMLLIRSIHATPLARSTWLAICAHLSATVCVDAYTWGIVFFRPGLPRQVFRHIIV